MVRNLLASWLGAAAARAVLRRTRDLPALRRTNFRGHEVTLAGGPALAVGATIGAVAGAALDAVSSRKRDASPAGSARSRGGERGAGAGGKPGADSARLAAAAAVAGLGSGAVGLYDDVVGGRPEHAAKGFTGHLRALREGRVTSGLVKIAGVGAAGLVASALLPRRRAVDVLLGAGVIAGAANLGNLLDLRPGRAIKAGMIVGGPLGRSPVTAGTLGAAGALLPHDLGEEIMLGDAGANALGALLGTAFVARAGTAGRLAALAGIVALTAASEKVSFTRVIERTPVLRELDAFGRKKPGTEGTTTALERPEGTTGPDESGR
jgi:UDP-N-acetylmuramyl pentapeptide phosphotransferase/UDP-N-acetylglucosamine-1-phosphate transferase